jgi:hypothetical protein
MGQFTVKRRFNYLLKLFFTGLVPLLAWMAFIFLLSSREKVAFTDNYPVSFSIFKTLHLIEYAALYLLWWRFLFLAGLKKPYLTALFLTFTYGLSDELHQSFINGREGKLLDACVDGLGGTLAMVIIKKNKLLEQIISL